MSEDADYDHSAAEIVWASPPPSLEVVAQVREDIKRELTDLARPSDLVFHTVFLSADMEGPTVTLWGRDDNSFDAEYSAKTEWKSIEDAI